MMSPDRRRFVKPAFDGNDGCIRGIQPVGDSLFLAMGNDLRIYDIRANRIRFSLEAHSGRAYDVRSVSPVWRHLLVRDLRVGAALHQSVDRRPAANHHGGRAGLEHRLSDGHPTGYAVVCHRLRNQLRSLVPNARPRLYDPFRRSLYLGRECDGQLWFTSYSEIYRLDPGNRLKRLAIPQALSIGDYAERSLVFNRRRNSSAAASWV